LACSSPCQNRVSQCDLIISSIGTQDEAVRFHPSPSHASEESLSSHQSSPSQLGSFYNSFHFNSMDIKQTSGSQLNSFFNTQRDSSCTLASTPHSEGDFLKDDLSEIICENYHTIHCNELTLFRAWAWTTLCLLEKPRDMFYLI
jgi:hypothetical protein